MLFRSPVSQVQSMIELNAMTPWLGIVGEPRVNVLTLNLLLDGKTAQPAR